jgi:adenylate cyclase
MEKPFVLIVDDTPQNLQVLGNMLREDGYKVAAAQNGKIALDAVQKRRPDCILLDIMMPKMDGFETCRRLKAQPDTQDIPVIFITALTGIEDKLKAFDVGGVDYITKPFQTEEVLARVGTHLRIQQLQKNLQEANLALERRNAFIRSTFGLYLSNEIVDTIFESPDGLALGGEKRVITMLVGDLRGFTSIGERLPAETVVEMLNIYLEAMTPIVFRYQGTIDEVFGDALLVLFGAPIEHDNDVEHAIACAIEMQLAMDDVNARMRQAGFPEMAMGIGIHTGEVVVGNIGSYERMKYGIVGRHVNLTFRIESYTVGGQILISDDARQACHAELRIDGQQQVMPKGVKQPITIYQVGGIEGEFTLTLPEQSPTEFWPVQPPLSLDVTILEGKHVGATAFPGQLIALAQSMAEIQVQQELQPLTNVKISVFDKSGTLLSDELYAKVIEPSESTASTFKIALTSIPTIIEPVFLQYREASNE